MNVIKILTITCCLVGAVSCAAPNRRQALVSQASQISSVNAPPTDPKQVAQQAKLHYMEIGPSLKGDYKFGYDTGSGPAGQSFREETRLDDGTVKGAYGYIDANGKQRIVKYTAGKAGFVVDGDQEAPGQGGPAAAAPQAAPAPVRPQPVPAPQPQQHHHHQQHRQPAAPAQPAFDDSAAGVPLNRAAAQQSHLSAEQLHAQQLRQHQLAQQQALAEQQRLAQELAQRQQLEAQQAAQAQAAQRAQQQQRQELANQHQFAARAPAQPQAQQQPAQFQQPAGPSHQVVDPQNGQFFSSSNDANLNELLANQFRQLQQGAGFAQQQFQAPPQPQAQPQAQPQQHLAAQAQPAFQAQFQPRQPQSLSPPANGPQPGFENFNHQLRARNVQQQPHQPQQHQQPLATPQAALLALHQQQQHDAQVLATLRQQQLAQLQQQPRQQQFETPVGPQHAAREHFQPAPAVPAAPAPVHQAPQPQAQLVSGPVNQAQAAPVQPEVFGPPVIDIRTLNYSIGQQTRVN